MDTPPRTAAQAPPQRVVKVRRDYNAWVASETIEDYALRFTPRRFRRWSEWRVANTAFGAASFLLLEAIGATLLLQFGWVNAFWAIVATGVIIFVAGLPISVYAARHGLDMDLLTRGAGFGYIGSTLTSLVYASFTFIFFALEAAIMAYALELAFGIPPAWGYLICALVVVPLVTHGITVIGRIQVWTQPLWLGLLIVPYVYVFDAHPTLLDDLRAYAGLDAPEGAGGFDPLKFGAALTVGIALFTQMGEQVDYLRFMPPQTPANRWRWWAGVVAGGPGWVVLGVLKMLGGALLALLVLQLAVPPERAVDPNQMYLAAYEIVFPHHGWAVGATALLVVVSQLKINVTNAYAGSLAWSNFFARATHSHPGRVVWVVFNILIALMLMELEVFGALSAVLGLFSNIAISWLMAVVADLVVNKPLGLSPKGVEFKRAHLHDINPVGVGAMALASVISIAAHLGAFGPWAQAFSALIAMVVAFVAAPLIAWRTRGRYYIARQAEPSEDGAYLGLKLDLATQRCTVCEREYEREDMAHCPAYGGAICSLCCALDARCRDRCKPPEARAAVQVQALLARVLPPRVLAGLQTDLGRWLLGMALLAPALAGLLGALYTLEARALAQAFPPADAAALGPLQQGFFKAYAALLLACGVAVWWGVLAQHSRRVAQEESERQTEALVLEIDNHRRTDEALQRAREAAEAARAAAEAANQAKTRHVSALSHELRTPLNSILGYAQMLDEDPATPPHRRQAVAVMRRGGEHLLAVIEGTLDIARIEAGKLALQPRPVALPELLAQLPPMFAPQAAAKGLRFEHRLEGLPAVVRADERRLAQILINVLGNAVKFTAAGHVRFTARHQHDTAVFEVEDTGPGIAPEERERVFEPFARGASAAGIAGAAGGIGGTGLGLTMARMLTELMGGEIRIEPGAGGVGTRFVIRLFLPALDGARLPATPPPRLGYEGRRRRVLVVDNEAVDRELLASRLAPLGFEVLQAASGAAALALLHEMAVDAILLDLAMPGLDGWQTLRSLRAQGLSDAPAAIVSANAYDKGLDNDLGITAADFITKPVRLGELLDWLGARLALTWRAAPAIAAPAAAPAETALPPPAALRQALREPLALGYVRGLQTQLQALATTHPAWAAQALALVQGFRLDALAALLDAADEADAADAAATAATADAAAAARAANEAAAP